MITSGGGPGVWGLLHALRHLPGRPTTLFVQDCDALPTLGTALADTAVHLPPASDPSYVARLVEFCRLHRVEVLIPVFDGELRGVARARNALESAGTHVLLPPASLVESCVSKWLTHERLAGTIFVPDFRLVETPQQTAEAIESLGYPSRKICARPVDLSGGRGVHIIDPHADLFTQHMLEKPGFFHCTASQFMRIRRDGPERFPLVLTPFLSGDDLGIDLLAEDGDVIEMVIRRKRGPMFHGNPIRMEFREQPGEREWVLRLASTLRLSGLVNIDAKCDEAGRPKLLEVNPRPSACIGMSCGIVHLLAWAIDRALRDRIVDQSQYYAVEPAVAALRVLADVCIMRSRAAVTSIDPPQAKSPLQSDAETCVG